LSNLYISDNSLQYSCPIQLATELWADPEWVAEELFSGYRAKLTSSADGNSLFVARKSCNGASLGKVLTNNFLHIKSLPVHKTLGDCEFDCVVVSSQKSDMETIFDVGPLGADNLNYAHGMFRLVLVDILKFKGVVLKEEPWRIRRVYLEDAFRKIGSPYVLLSESVSEHKRDFFNVLSTQGSKGIIFKNTYSIYHGGIGRDFLEARSLVSAGFKNVTLRDGFKFSPMSRNTAEGKFDFDVYLALQALDKKENIDKLLGI